MNDLITQPQQAVARTAFDVWWHDEGSGMPPLPGEDAETHVHRVCKLAWLNGADKAQSQTEKLFPQV